MDLLGRRSFTICMQNDLMTAILSQSLPPNIHLFTTQVLLFFNRYNTFDAYLSGRGSENNSIAQARSPLGIEGPQKTNFVKNVKCESRGHRQHHQQHSEDEGKCYLRIFYCKLSIGEFMW